MKYYREPNGDYLAIDTSTAKYYIETQGKRLYEGRATAISNLVESVCTTAISPVFLKRCKRVTAEQIPQTWMSRLSRF